jgi:hypothetical protein
MVSPFKNDKGSVLNNGCKVLMLQLINRSSILDGHYLSANWLAPLINQVYLTVPKRLSENGYFPSR